MEWEAVIGLEVHVQLNTQSKIFSGASTMFGNEPNTQACAVDLGLPGVLPVLNQQAVEKAVRFGLGINAHINQTSIFARKNYFYPDLPKGYQISQMDLPTVGKGELAIQVEEGKERIIGVTRAHLEEDAGKSLHEDFHGMTGIDLNRAGTPLLEIVSEPDLRNASEAVAYLKAVHQLVTWLDISDGDMSQGSMRCDANVSVRPVGQEAFGTRAEVKNVNSFRFVEKAIDYEIERQINLLESGGTVVQETRLYDSDKNETRSMRGKEEANDYRYFPDPDLLPVEVTTADMDRIRASLPELPAEKRVRFAEQYQLTEADALVLTQDRATAEFFEAVAKSSGDARAAANWVNGELAKMLNREGLSINDSKVSATMLAGLLKRISDNTVSGKIAKTVFEAMWQGEGDADDIIEKKGLKQVTDSGAIEKMVDEVLANCPDQVEQYKGGQTKVVGFLVGQVMKASKGKANPQQVNQLLRAKLDT